ncbi:MAG: hypothetical protein V4527_18275 [Pseudomonadota bacterium]
MTTQPLPTHNTTADAGVLGNLSLLLADCRQALFDAVKQDEGAGNALRYEVGRAIGLMGRAMDALK